MATATILSVSQDSENVYASVIVVETEGRKEYNASVNKISVNWDTLTNAEKRDVLTLAVKTVRDSQRSGKQNIAGITGTVTI